MVMRWMIEKGRPAAKPSNNIEPHHTLICQPHLNLVGDSQFSSSRVSVKEGTVRDAFTQGSGHLLSADGDVGITNLLTTLAL